MNILTGVKLLVIAGNVLWIAVEYSHVHYSNMEVYGTLKTGKTSIALDNVQALLGRLDTYNKCILVNKTNSQSYTKEFVYLYGGLSDDAIIQLERMDDISNCLHNPYTVLDAVEQSARAGMNNGHITDDSTGQNELSDVLSDESSALMLHTSNHIIASNHDDSQRTIIPRFQDLTKDLTKDLAVSVSTNFDVIAYNQGVQQIQYELLQTCRFEEGIHYLENLADPRNYDLARKILNEADFTIYKQEMDSKQTQKDGPIPEQIVNIRSAPTLYQRSTIILGTVYELFVSKPSHTHLFDIINKVRDTITEYSRNMRNQYNLYNDLFYDTRMELERITTKSTVAWKRASWLIVNTGILVVQVGEFIMDDAVPAILYYTKPILVETIKPLMIETVKPILLGSVAAITNVDTGVIDNLVETFGNMKL